jgi:hypothetical protein
MSFIPTVPQGCLPPEAAFAEGDVAVIMVFPVQVILSTAGENPVNPIKRIHYPAGVHNVPESLADHWWLKAHGAVRHKVSPTVVTAGGEASATAEVASAQSSKPKKKG